MKRVRWAAWAGAALVLAAAGIGLHAVIGGQAHSVHGLATSWSPTSGQINAVRPMLISWATHDDPYISDAAGAAASAATSWPANVKCIQVLGTDRSSALALMGDAGAAPTDQRHVLLVQITGRFIDRNMRVPYGLSPRRGTVTHLLIAIDAASGQTTDTGGTNNGMDMSSPHTVELTTSTTG